jgi:hypothetical protein
VEEDDRDTAAALVYGDLPTRHGNAQSVEHVIRPIDPRPTIW